MQFDFSRKFTGFLKGAAIIFMIIHHAFGFPEWYINGLAYPSLSGLYMHIRQLTVICVGIFAFLTGYTYSLNKTKTYRYSLKKIITFLKDYWIVYALLLALSVVFCGYRPTVISVTKELFALERPVMNFCWYVTFYICIMLIFPLYTKLIKHDYIVYDLLLAAVFVLITDRYAGKSEYIYYVREYMPIVLSGYIIGKYNLFALIYEKMKLPRTTVILSGLLLVTAGAVLQTVKASFLTINISAFSVPVFIFGLYLTEIYKIRFVDSVMLFLGRHSMNVWFIHCIFFSNVTNKVFQRFAYLPKNPVPVTVWIFVVCILVSLALSPVQRLVKAKRISGGTAIKKDITA